MTELILKADRRLTAERGRRDTHFVMASFRAPRLDRSGDRPPLNLSIVLDRSGSMDADNKLPLAKRAADLALARLTSKDRFSLVMYDTDVDVVMPSTLATPAALDEVRRELRHVSAGRTTALFEGYIRGAEQVAEHLHAGELGKVLLLTDGLANVGLVDPEQIAQHVGELRTRGVLTSTYGVGADFNQLLLEAMSDTGGGNFYFVENAGQLEDLMTSEVGEALETVARDVNVTVEHPRDIEVRLLDAFKVESHRHSLVTRIGALTSEQLVELVYEVDIPGREAGEMSGLRFAVTDADERLGAPVGSLEFRHASNAEVEAEEADADVVREAARRIRLEAGERAFALNYMGRRGDVRKEASKALEYLERLAKRNPQIRDLLDELHRDVEVAGKVMSVMALKQAYYGASRLRRGRDVFGKAVKDKR